MTFEGEVRDLDLIDKMVELWEQTFTGAFRFERDSTIKIVYFKEGNVLSASTNDRSDSVDEVLLRAGKITREHIRQALGKRKDSETLGDALLALGFINRKELAWARRAQLLGIVRSLGEWTEGNYTLVGEYLPKREEGTVFSLPQLVLELIVTDPDREKFARSLREGEYVPVRSPHFDREFPLLGLNEEADAIASRIDGWRSANEIAATSGSDTFRTFKLIEALRRLHLVSEVSRDLPLTTPQATLEVSAPPSASTGELLPSIDEPYEPTTERYEPEVYAGAGQQDQAPLPEQELETPQERWTTPVPAPLPPITHEEYPEFADDPEPSMSPIEASPVTSQTISYQRSSGRSRKGLWITVLVLLAILGAGAWYAWQWWSGSPSAPVATDRGGEVLLRPEPAAGAAATPLSGTTDTGTIVEVETADEPIVETPGGVLTTTTTAPAAVTPAQSTTTAAQATPPATRVPAPAPAIQPVTPPVTAARTPAAPAPKPVATITPSAEGSDPLRARYDTMARNWANAGTGGFTVQFELVCQTASITKAIEAGGDTVWFVPTRFSNRDCYRVFWGRYSTREAALAGAESIPAQLREGSVPTVVRAP